MKKKYSLKRILGEAPETFFGLDFLKPEIDTEPVVIDPAQKRGGLSLGQMFIVSGNFVGISRKNVLKGFKRQKGDSHYTELTKTEKKSKGMTDAQITDAYVSLDINPPSGKELNVFVISGQSNFLRTLRLRGSKGGTRGVGSLSKAATYPKFVYGSIVKINPPDGKIPTDSAQIENIKNASKNRNRDVLFTGCVPLESLYLALDKSEGDTGVLSVAERQSALDAYNALQNTQKTTIDTYLEPGGFRTWKDAIEEIYPADKKVSITKGKFSGDLSSTDSAKIKKLFNDKIASAAGRGELLLANIFPNLVEIGGSAQEAGVDLVEVVTNKNFEVKEPKFRVGVKSVEPALAFSEFIQPVLEDIKLVLAREGQMIAEEIALKTTDDIRAMSIEDFANLMGFDYNSLDSSSKSKFNADFKLIEQISVDDLLGEIPKQTAANIELIGELQGKFRSLEVAHSNLEKVARNVAQPYFLQAAQLVKANLSDGSLIAEMIGESGDVQEVFRKKIYAEYLAAIAPTTVFSGGNIIVVTEEGYRIFTPESMTRFVLSVFINDAKLLARITSGGVGMDIKSKLEEEPVADLQTFFDAYSETLGEDMAEKLKLTTESKYSLMNILREDCESMILGDPIGTPYREEIKSKSREGIKSKAKLFRIAQKSQSMHDRLLDDDNLPEWVQDMITTSEDRLRAAYDYIEYKLHRMKTDGVKLTEARKRKLISDMLKVI